MKESYIAPCRYMRELIGNWAGPVRFPVVPSVNRPNRLLGLPAQAPKFVVAVGSRPLADNSLDTLRPKEKRS